MLGAVKNPRLNPLHCGAVVASPPRGGDRAALRASQSPSLRGSGRFTVRLMTHRPPYPGLNPLHCGAVVASPPRRMAGAGKEDRLNPLHCGAVVASWGGLRLAGSCCSSLNPLHCGAVVASGGGASGVAPRDFVSIPFIAGQWSLPAKEVESRKQAEAVSIPFIAGQWSLQEAPIMGALKDPLRLNPLHCGAVVASMRV